MAETTYTLTVLIKDPSSILFEGTLDAISTFNTFGPLDILPLHENFISIITKELTLHMGADVRKFPVDLGVMTVTEDKVTILLGVQALLDNPKPENKQ